jgi:hypothetical protein
MEELQDILLQAGDGMQRVDREELKRRLAGVVNEMMAHDFPRLVQVLYRVDVSEKKLKLLLHEHPEQDAGDIIADLLIERQLEKLRLKQQFGRKDADLTDEDTW